MTEIAAVMVLAAGRGVRMRPLSDVVPKPALPLADGPVIASALNLATSIGAPRIVVNTWHLGDRMGAAITEATPPGAPVVVSQESALMGTAGGLGLARHRGFLGTTGSIVVINGDGLLDLDLEALFERHQTGCDDVTLGLLPHPNPSLWSHVLVDDRGFVRGIRPPGGRKSHEQPRLYPGVMAVSRDVLDKLPPTPGETPDRLWYPALSTGRLGGALLTGSWREVGTPEDYRAVVTRQLHGRSVVHPAARVAPSAKIEDSLIGHDSVIGDSAVIRSSVVAEGARVDAHGSVNHSVLLGAARVTGKETVDNQCRAEPTHTDR